MIDFIEIFSNPVKHEIDDSSIDMFKLSLSCTKMTNDQLCKSFDILFSSNRNSDNTYKIKKMKYIFSGYVEVEAKFERWIYKFFERKPRSLQLRG